MFNKLRNRFLIVNLVTISVLMLLAFASIYTITYRNAQNDIRSELSRIATIYPRNAGNGQMPPNQGGMNNAGGMNNNGQPNDNAFTERSLSFSIETDSNWNMTAAHSPFEMDSTLYQSALTEAKTINKDNGQFKLDSSDWAFIKQPTGSGYKLIFLDITAQQDILRNLIYTFAAVGLIMLVALYFTSRFFANRSIQPVKEAFDKQKQFIADASHELKTPLAIINTNADVLLSNREETIESQARWLEYIKLETERMARLTNDLLYLTEMEGSRTQMVYTPFDLSETTERIILTMEAVIFEKELTLDYHIEPNLMINGSQEQIHQVIMILLDNAIKYVNAQGTITIALKRQPHEVSLTVTNTGEGIAPEHLTRIFDRFYRTDTSRARKQGGYGLGLAIASSIVDQHSGKLYATSTIGESTTFHLQFNAI